MVGLLEFGRRNVAERFEQAAAVVPRDPLEGRELDVLEPLPRPATMDLLRLEQPDHGLCQRVVVRVTGAADRRLDARLGQPLRVPNRQILLKFNRSSQHRTERGCDDDTKKAFGTGRTSETTLARPALGSAA